MKTRPSHLPNHADLYVDDDASREELLLCDIVQQFEGTDRTPSRSGDYPRIKSRCALGVLAMPGEHCLDAAVRLGISDDAWKGWDLGHTTYDEEEVLDAAWRVMYDADTDGNR